MNEDEMEQVGITVLVKKMLAAVARPSKRGLPARSSRPKRAAVKTARKTVIEIE